jgi:glycerophosphoryl diester phosphodiesterase
MAIADPLCDPDARIVVAHRGDSICGGENTIEALRRGVALGADALEFDVRMTRDGVAVLLHDATVDRTTNGRGRLSAFTLDEVRQLTADPKRSRPGGGHVRIPTLDEVLEQFPRTPLIVEVKEMSAAEPTERAIRRHGLHENVVVGSADADVSARLERTGLRTCASMRDAAMLIPVALLGMKPNKPTWDVLSITPNYHGLPVPVVAMTEAARKVGVATHVWTVNNPGQALTLWKAGVAAVLTDDPAAIIRARTQ